MLTGSFHGLTPHALILLTSFIHETSLCLLPGFCPAANVAVARPISRFTRTLRPDIAQEPGGARQISQVPVGGAAGDKAGRCATYLQTCGREYSARTPYKLKSYGVRVLAQCLNLGGTKKKILHHKTHMHRHTHTHVSCTHSRRFLNIHIYSWCTTPPPPPLHP